MLDIECHAILSGYDRKTCWVHPRAGAIPRPGQPPVVVLTMHAMRLSGDDVFYPICDMRTDDGGKSWTGPREQAEAFARRSAGEGVEKGVSDWWPAWHAASQRLLGIGHTVPYSDDNIPGHAVSRSTAYAVYDDEAGAWSPWQALETPFPEEGAGSVQRLDLPNGDILLPTYFVLPEMFNRGIENRWYSQFGSAVMRCRFDGETLRYIEHGNELTLPADGNMHPGFVEPSLTQFQDRYFLTLRNTRRGYVTSAKDGLHFDEPRGWTFDDGSDLGNYETQQHWLAMPDALYLVYTRRGADNDNVARHRAPLFIGQVDPERLCVLRDTEQILVPNRGARLGNFGVTPISPTESWVTVAEWMQTTPPDPFDCTVCEQYGSDNSVFVVKVRANK
ncbi:MAG: exo-alpha-sialidase [Candidatus Marinimicrobia bacterium]|nr:exo-alpha-sialidase [Candidatus Neomarinimicrobiota bacterium]